MEVSQVHGITRTLRSYPPSHYLFKVESFSLMAEATLEKFKSDAFEAGGHRWRLVLYPNGNKKSSGSGHISLYLEIEKTENFSLNWEVNVDFKLFVYDQIQDQYLSIKDTEVPVRRFYEMRKEWGFSQLLPQETFKNGGNGYLVDDCCIFGAEVFRIEPPPKLGQLSFIKDPSDRTITWKIENFSLLDQEFYYSPVKFVGGIKWYLKVFPKGNAEGKGTHLSPFLALVEPEELPPKCQVYGKFKLRLRELDAPLENCFDISSPSWGYRKFVSLKDLKESSKGYVVQDALIVEAELLVISKLN